MYFIEEGSATLLYGTSWGVCWCDGDFASVTGDSKPFAVREEYDGARRHPADFPSSGQILSGDVRAPAIERWTLESYSLSGPLMRS